MQQQLRVFLFITATRHETDLESDMCGNDLAVAMERRKLALEIAEAVSLAWLLDKIVDSVAKVRKFQGKRRECSSRRKVKVLNCLHLSRIQLSSLPQFVEDFLVLYWQLDPDMTGPIASIVQAVMEELTGLRTPHMRGCRTGRQSTLYCQVVLSTPWPILSRVSGRKCSPRERRASGLPLVEGPSPKPMSRIQDSMRYQVQPSTSSSQTSAFRSLCRSSQSPWASSSGILSGSPSDSEGSVQGRDRHRQGAPEP